MTVGGQATAEPIAQGVPLEAGTLCEAFQATVDRFPDQVALRSADGPLTLTWRDYATRVAALAGGLAQVGVGPGDTVGLMLTNRPEAMIVDTAAMHLGAIPLSIYNTSSPEQIEYLITHASCRLLVTETRFLDSVEAARASTPRLRDVVLVDGQTPGTRHLAELERDGGDQAWELEAMSQVRPGSIATLIYTSGTTGPPKGVELTHDNLLAQWRSISQLHPLRPGGRLVSYLPMAHLADRMAAHYASLVSGASVTCVEDPKAVMGALPHARPTMWMAVPRIWEKLRAALAPQFTGATSDEDRAHMAQAVRNGLGLDDVDLLLSGAAPIAPEVLSFFKEQLGLEIYEVWGMTETSAAATVSPRGQHRVGTVGKAIPGVEVKLADDRELLIRGPIVMRGYRNDPAQTAEVLDSEGWMHTGDIGEIDDDGYVRVIDRKKELIINAAGKNMSPANIENTIKSACPLVGSVIAIGDGRPYNTALIALDPDAAAAFAADRGLTGRAVNELVTEAELYNAIEQGVNAANRRLSRVEQIKRFELLAEIWEPGGEELTPTMKLRRREITRKYASVIEGLYADGQ